MSILERAFSAREVEVSLSLRTLYWALLGGYALTFHEWTRMDAFTREAVEANRHLCWPHFQGCADWYFLSAGLDGAFPQTVFYAALLAILLGGAAAAWTGRWPLALAALVPAFLWKLAVHHLFTMSLIANYHLFHLAISAVFLVAANKRWWLRRTLALLYVLSAIPKLHAGWLAGTYFSSLAHGLPLVPDALIPVATNAVILLETLGTFALFSRRTRVRRAAVAAFTAFHLYSAILVGFPYPLFCLPLLLALFALDEPETRPTLAPRAIPAALVIAVILLGQSIPALIRGPARLTLEGNAYGVHMFESNHQCVSTVTLHDLGGGTHDASTRSTKAGNRCDPYAQWFTIRNLCERNAGKLERIDWTFDHSIDGADFLRIVDERDACSLRYAAFRHNEWIRLPPDAVTAGTATKNAYR